MKISINSAEIKHATAAVNSLIEEHQILLYTDKQKDCLIMEAGQNGVFLKQKIPATIFAEGELVINSSYLSSLKLSESLDLTATTPTTLKFKSGKLSGTLETHQASQVIKDQRPLVTIDTPIHISKDILAKAIHRTNFSSGLVQTQEGLRVKIDTHIALSTTDQYRVALYKEEMPLKNEGIDFVIKPSTIALAVSKIKEPEVWIGLHKGTIKLASPTFEFYQPAIQTEPTDVEEWLKDLDPNDQLGEIVVDIKNLLNTIQEVTSICGSGSSVNDVRLKCKVTNKNMVIAVNTPHGNAETGLDLDESDISFQEFLLHNKYTLEMLSLIKEGTIKAAVYDSFIVLRALEGKCISVIPTMSD